MILKSAVYKEISMKLDWKALCKLEPKLRVLERKAARLAAANAESLAKGGMGIWYTKIKPDLIPCVGWGRDIPGFESDPPPEDGKLFKSLEQILKEADRRAESIPENLRVLYSAEAYDIAYDHLLSVLNGASADLN